MFILWRMVNGNAKNRIERISKVSKDPKFTEAEVVFEDNSSTTTTALKSGNINEPVVRGTEFNKLTVLIAI